MMKIPRYWANDTQTVVNEQGRQATMAVWWWSNLSLEDAKQQATQHAREVARKFLERQSLNRYSYGERPIREEIVQSINNSLGQELAIVTRNAYGSLVLNTEKAMFVDIDFKDAPRPAAEKGLLALAKKLLGGADAAEPPAPETAVLQRVSEWVAGQPGVGVRVYRTAAGMRCLMTHSIFDPTHESTLAMMRALHADPLYVTLCRNQQCFRARLTPKHWRCDVPRPPSRYPWASRSAEEHYRIWQARYEQATARFGVCRLVAHLGSQELHADVAPIVEFHDRLACSSYATQLA